MISTQLSRIQLITVFQSSTDLSRIHSHAPTTASTIALNTATDVSRSHSQAMIAPATTWSMICFPSSVCVKNQTSAATSATIAAMMNPAGFAIMATLRSRNAVVTMPITLPIAVNTTDSLDTQLMIVPNVVTSIPTVLTILPTMSSTGPIAAANASAARMTFCQLLSRFRNQPMTDLTTPSTCVNAEPIDEPISAADSWIAGSEIHSMNSASASLDCSNTPPSSDCPIIPT